MTNPQPHPLVLVLAGTFLLGAVLWIVATVWT